MGLFNNAAKEITEKKNTKLMLIWVSVSGQYSCLSIIYPTMLELGVSLSLSLFIFLSVILSINALVTLCCGSSGSQSNGLTPLLCHREVFKAKKT